MNLGSPINARKLFFKGTLINFSKTNVLILMMIFLFRFTVTVEDNTRPKVYCQDVTISLHPQTGLATLTVEDIQDMPPTNNCLIDPTSIRVLSPQISFTCLDVGRTIAAQQEAKDTTGNSQLCTAAVSIVVSIRKNPKKKTT